MDLKLGDIVQLKSGGPNMTISKVDRHNGYELICVWIDGNTFYQISVSAEALIFVS